MNYKLWLAVARAIGGLLLSGAAIVAAYQSSKNKPGRYM